MNETQKWLERARYADKRINALSEQAERIESRLHSGRMSSLTGMPRGGSGDWTDQADKVLLLRAEIARQEAIKTEVHQAICALSDPRYAMVLELRYINGYKWAKIARTIPCDERTATRWHGRALQKLAKILEAKDDGSGEECNQGD